MIEALTFDISGHPLHITRGKMLQCIAFRRMVTIYDEVFDCMFQNWNTLFPTASEFRLDLPRYFDEAFNSIFKKIRTIYARFDEEIPYDEEAVKDARYVPALHILHQISIGKYKPDFGHPTPEDKQYESALQEYDFFPEETFEKYLKFGHK